MPARLWPMPMPLPIPKLKPSGPKLPEHVAKLIKAKSGYANYYFNELERDRVWKAFTAKGDFTGQSGAWKLCEGADLESGRCAAICDRGLLVLEDGRYETIELDVVLPLLQAQTVATGWISSNAFLSGYGAAQAVPGPLFTFAAFLGWLTPGMPSHWAGAALATVGIFLPGLLLVVASLPYWQALRTRRSMVALLAGVNAAVVGVLASALYSPVWTSAVKGQLDFAIASVAFFLLVRWKLPPIVVVALCAIAGVACA